MKEPKKVKLLVPNESEQNARQSEEDQHPLHVCPYTENPWSCCMMPLTKFNFYYALALQYLVASRSRWLFPKNWIVVDWRSSTYIESTAGMSYEKETPVWCLYGYIFVDFDTSNDFVLIDIRSWTTNRNDFNRMLCMIYGYYGSPNAKYLFRIVGFKLNHGRLSHKVEVTPVYRTAPRVLWNQHELKSFLAVMLEESIALRI